MSLSVVTPEITARPIADYDCIRLIGRGAYGQVWLARNITGSYVALKIVERSAFEHQRPFEREFEGIKRFEPISRTDSSQVSILHVGRGDDFFYYVMELADDATGTSMPNEKCSPRFAQANVSFGEQNRGGVGNPMVNAHWKFSAEAYAPLTLKHLLLDHGALPAELCLQIALSLTRALTHLHKNNLVHRDIKPSNVIFVNGVAKLADIGLVTGVDATRSFVGTEGYLPPEGTGTPQADLYSLGKVLYEISTGLDRQDFPKIPSHFKNSSELSTLSELNEIIVKACALRVGQRYASAEAMWAELRLLQAGKSVKRRRAMHRGFALYGGALLVAALVFAVISLPRFTTRSAVQTEHAPRPSSSEEANELYKSGMYFYEKNTGVAMFQAVRDFEKAVELDPNFALAHAVLASSYCWGLYDFKPNFSKARQHAERAMALDPNLAEPHKALARIKHTVDWDWAGSEREFEKAIELAPNDPSVHEWHGAYLLWMGRFDAAIQELQQADRLSTRSLRLSLSIRSLLAGTYAASREDNLAIHEFERVINLETNRPTFAYLALANLSELRGEFPKAIDLCETWNRLAGYEDSAKSSQRYSELRAAYTQNGPSGYWQKRIEWAQRDGQDDTLAKAYAQLGRADDAFKALWAEFKSDPAALACSILSDPSLSSLRSDPRYEELLQAMKLK